MTEGTRDQAAATRCPGDPKALSYANLTGRRPGRLMRLGALLLPRVAAVEQQISPYAAAWHEANAQALGVRGTRWVVLGDSMSVGIGASSPFNGWVGQTQRLLAAHGVDVNVVNLAAYGARTEDVMAQQIPAWRQLGRSGGPEVVSVFIGANDLMKRKWRRRLPSSFDRLLHVLPVGSVVAKMPQRRDESVAVNREIDAGEHTHGLRTVDMNDSDRQSWDGLLAGDHFHPNDGGYQVIAAAFEPVLQTAFSAASDR